MIFKIRKRSSRSALPLLLLMSTASIGMTGCKTFEKTNHNKTYENETLASKSLKSKVYREPKSGGAAIDVSGASPTNPVYTPPSQVGTIPSIADRTSYDDLGPNQPRPKIKSKTVDAYVPALPLPEFIDIVFGEMLKTPYITGPKVALRKDVVQLRSSGEVKSGNFLALVTTALKEYGVQIVVEDGSFLILEDKSLRARMPRYIKSRARMRTRNDLRPVVQFVELEALDSNGILVFLQQAFREKRDQITITSDTRNNYIILSGLPQEVDAAVGIIRELDELNFAGREVQRFTPRYWNVEELSEELTRALKTEGWQVSSDPGAVRTITLMPVPYSNDLFVFTTTEQALRRVSSWMREFDRPIEGGDKPQIFIYQVENVDAVTLAETANSVIELGGDAFKAEQDPATGTGATGLGGAQETQRVGGVGQDIFTVDPLGNRIIFSGTTAQFERYNSLLKQLDTPSPEVLIEVQIAEVTLTDNTNFGVEFFRDGTTGGNFFNPATGVDIGTGGLGLGSAGVTIGILSGDVEASINAFANNRRVKLLSTPVITAKSGGSASIQVGTDIPILTSQGASNVIGQDGTTNIQQNVQYRKTGVLLSIEPIVFSDNRVDLTISQEVSSTLDSSAGGISSPSISNRSISTQLSLEDGSTAVLGGLVQENYVRDEKGVPVLKDIPIVGSVFSGDTLSLDRTELVVLITAYVLRGQADKTQFVNHFSGQIDTAIADEGRLVTLLPKNF